MKGEETWHASQTKTQSGTHNSEDDQRDEDCTPLEISLSSSWEEEKRRQKGSEKDTQNRIPWLPACRQSIAWGVEWATEWKCLEQSSQTRYEFISLGIIMYNKQTKRRKKKKSVCSFLSSPYHPEQFPQNPTPCSLICSVSPRHQPTTTPFLGPTCEHRTTNTGQIEWQNFRVWTILLNSTLPYLNGPQRLCAAAAVSVLGGKRRDVGGATLKVH